MIMKCTLIYYNNNEGIFSSIFRAIHLKMKKRLKKLLNKFFNLQRARERRKASLMNKISRFVQVHSVHVAIRYLWHFLAGTRNNGHGKMMRNFHVYTLNERRHS